MERLRSKPLPLISSLSLHPWQDTPADAPPHQRQNSFQAIFITTAPKIKTAEAPLQLSILTRPPFSRLL